MGIEESVSRDVASGYTVAYERDEVLFPVYALALIAAAFVGAGVARDVPALAALALVPASAFFYNLPLLETGKPRLGAGQYGMFLEGLGLVQWRAIDGIDLVPCEVRGSLFHELHVSLKASLDASLILDWRQRPLPRRFMRLPWSQRKGIIRVPLDIMDKPPAEIHATLLRMWRFHRGR